ncbi:MAG TPA: pyridoxal phosphate-dependent aminotransferase, partial [Ferruginibacter sp.]|nr:pyridoxal phosphate-dependent aminotransferase [Ferruginibacter sp.]
MLTISKRGQQMPPSPIRKLVPYAEAAKRKGTKVYHLNIGQPDIETPQVALDAVRKSDFKVLEYSHSAGNESYRRKLAGYYK